MDNMIPLKVLSSPGNQSSIRSQTSAQAAEPKAGDQDRMNGKGAGGQSLEPSSPTGGKKHVELSRIHDFASKLTQPEILPRVKEYVRWHSRLRGAEAAKDEVALKDLESVPDFAPVSINLDLTTACNYAVRPLRGLGHTQSAGIKLRARQADIVSLQFMSRKGIAVRHRDWRRRADALSEVRAKRFVS